MQAKRKGARGDARRSQEKNGGRNDKVKIINGRKQRNQWEINPCEQDVEPKRNITRPPKGKLLIVASPTHNKRRQFLKKTAVQDILKGKSGELANKK